MNEQKALFSASSTTADPPQPGLLIRVSLEDGGYMVRDFTGTRYGFGSRLRDAIEQWEQDVWWFVAEPLDKLSGPALIEAMAYRKALGHA